MWIHLVTNRHVLVDKVQLQNCTVKTIRLTENMGLGTQQLKTLSLTHKKQIENETKKVPQFNM